MEDLAKLQTSCDFRGTPASINMLRGVIWTKTERNGPVASPQLLHQPCLKTSLHTERCSFIIHKPCLWLDNLKLDFSMIFGQKNSEQGTMYLILKHFPAYFILFLCVLSFFVTVFMVIDCDLPLDFVPHWTWFWYTHSGIPYSHPTVPQFICNAVFPVLVLS